MQHDHHGVMCLLDCFSYRQRIGSYTKLTVTSHDRSGISRERGSHPWWQQQRQRPLLDLPARLLQCCEVHEYIISVITSGVICVLKLCYALRQTHILITCTCNWSMHISAHAALLHAHFSTCNSLGPRPKPTPARIASSRCDPCWGGFGSGTETS